MKRIFLISTLLVFLSTSIVCLVGCSNREEDYQLQEQCGKRCEEKFMITYKPLNYVIYNCNYNKKLNKCYMVFYNNKEKNFMDVNKNKIEGSIILDYDGSSMMCFVGDKKCKSLEEWDKLVKFYMEE